MTAESQSIADQLHSAAVHLVRTVASIDTQMGLSPARASVLSILVFGGPRTIGQLAAAERVQSPSMTALVNGLVTDGLARKRPSPHDARSVVVEPTARGRRILHQGRARRVARLEQLMTGLDTDELACLQRAAAIMERATTATADQPSTPAGTDADGRPTTSANSRSPTMNRRV